MENEIGDNENENVNEHIQFQAFADIVNQFAECDLTDLDLAEPS